MWATVDRLGARIMSRAPRVGLPIRAIASRSIGEAELSLLPMLCDRSKMSIDIGANFGIYSYRMQRFSRGVVAFEPNPSVARRLRKALPSIRVEQYALSDRSGTATLHMPRMPSGGAMTGYGTLKAMPGDIYVIQVPVRRLDDFDFRGVGFIKIDVEGLEIAVLAGAGETLRRERPNLLIEAEGAEAAAMVADLLSGFGYAAEFLHEGRLRPFSQWSPDLRTRFGIPPFNFVFRRAISG